MPHHGIHCMGRQIVLVIDDDIGAKDVARDILELCGHRVLTAGTRGDALVLCDQWASEIDTVVLDASRTEPISAATLIEKIRETSPSAKLIVTSIYRDVQNVSASGFLKKPYRMSELMYMLDKIQDQ